MSARSLIVGLSVVCSAASLALRAEEAPDVRNWPAPPYWTARPSGEAPEPAQARGPAGSSRRALAGAPVALPFIALPPCRLVDTRGNAPLTGGFLPPATVRSYTLAGVCNVPASAQAISLNVTVVHPTGPGFITLYPQGGTFPPVSTLNYLGNDVIVNAAVVPLSVTGGISMALGVSGGDVILDTNGYYAAVPSVSSLNALTGDVALLAGTNVTLTPSGNLLTIASAGAQGPVGPTGPTGPQGPPGPNGWALTGNVGTNPAANFIGTTDGAGFEIRVANSRVARFEGVIMPSVILGDSGNSVTPGAAAATVSGGGWSAFFGATGWGDNIVTADGGTVGGGIGNQAGDNDGVVSTGKYVTVSGGFFNEAFGEISTISGGHQNTAPGEKSTVPGGFNNQAGGAFSLAAGNSARIRSAAQAGTPSGDHGTFVWADSPAGGSVDFSSTAANQFLVRAGGGFGINTNSPGYSLEVSSATDTQLGIRSATTGGRVWTLQSSNGQAGGTLSGSFQIVDRTAVAARLSITSTGLVGIGTTDPLGFLLAVNGTAAKPGGGSWSTYSDARLKRDVRPLEGTLDRLLALRGVRFEYVDPAAIHELPGTRIGMLAQEVEQIFPDWVTEGPDGYRRLAFSGFEALTVEALRDLRSEKDAEIAALRAALETQRGEIAALREAVERIRTDLPKGRGER